MEVHRFRVKVWNKRMAQPQDPRAAHDPREDRPERPERPERLKRHDIPESEKQLPTRAAQGSPTAAAPATAAAKQLKHACTYSCHAMAIR